MESEVILFAAAQMMRLVQSSDPSLHQNTITLPPSSHKPTDTTRVGYTLSGKKVVEESRGVSATTGDAAPVGGGGYRGGGQGRGAQSNRGRGGDYTAYSS